jgi:hypothetical protein
MFSKLKGFFGALPQSVVTADRMNGFGLGFPGVPRFG